MNQDRGTQILFGVFFIVLPALYFLWRLIPYLLFYLLPMVLASVLFAGLWILALKTFSEEEDFWLGLIIPVSGIFIFLVVGFPKVYLATKTGVLQTLPIDGVFIFNTFNSVKTFIDHALWAIIPEGAAFLAPTNPAPKELYDLNTVRWILWIGLGIGAPILFLIFSINKARTIQSAIEEKYKKIADDNRAELKAVKMEKRDALRAADNTRRQVEQERDHYREEYAKLKALIEFQKKANAATEPNSTPEKKRGVLDSEDL